jgi:hypothetical protein
VLGVAPVYVREGSLRFRRGYGAIGGSSCVYSPRRSGWLKRQYFPMAISGMELLERARSLDAVGLRALAGPNATPESDSLTRPALVAALLSSFRPADRALVRYLTQFEIERARAEQVGGAGDVLMACRSLLLMIGQVEDSQLVWEAKELNFDTFCYIDSVFLIPEGIEAAVAFAAATGSGTLRITSRRGGLAIRRMLRMTGVPGVTGLLAQRRIRAWRASLHGS